MGDAKKRGTFEERHRLAKQRNLALTHTIYGGKNEEVKRALRHVGAQRLALALQMAGALYVK